MAGTRKLCRGNASLFPKKGQFYIDNILRFIFGLLPVNTGPAYGCAAAMAPVLAMKPFGISLWNKDVLV